MSEAASEELKFTCEECGKEFDPDPDSMVELKIGGECPHCEGHSHEEVEAMLERGEAITGAELAAMSDAELKEHGITPADREKLLLGKTVAVGGMCICRECQDRLAEEQS